MKKWVDERHEVIGWFLILLASVYAVVSLAIVWSTRQSIGPVMSNWTALGILALGVYLAVGKAFFSGLKIQAGPLTVTSSDDASVDAQHKETGDDEITRVEG